MDCHCYEPHEAPYPVALLSKGFCRMLMERCRSCGAARIEAILDSMAGKKALCTRCAASKAAVVSCLSNGLPHKDTLKDFAASQLYRKTVIGIVAGIAFFGPRAPQAAGVPSSVTWNVTNKCNLRCLHCYTDAKARKPRGELDTKEAFRAVDAMASAGVAALTLSGGEPLLRKDVFRIARRAAGKGIHVSMETNGTNIGKKDAKKLVNWGVRAVDVALDGGVPKTHDIFRQSAGCFRLATEGIANCVETGAFDDVSVTLALTERNWSEVAIAYDHAQRLHCTSFHVTPLLPAGRASGLRSPVTVPQRIEVMRFMQMQLRERAKDALKGRSRPLALGKNMPYYARFAADAGTPLPDGRMYFALRAIRRNDSRLEGSAMAAAQALLRTTGAASEGVTACALLADGSIVPSPASPTPLGNILEQGLRRVWLSDRTLNAMRDHALLKGKCGACAHKAACGGSRVHSFVSTYDWLESDPGCPY